MLRETPRTSFHPGSYLQELLIWQHINPEEFSGLTGIPRLKVVDITTKKCGIDEDTSKILADYFGNSSQFWLDLQANFDRQD